MNRSTRMGALVLATLAPLGLQAVTFSLVNLRSDGTPPSDIDVRYLPAVSPDGRFVVFIASATNLVTPSASGLQVYLRDRVAGSMELISVNTSGGAGNSSSDAVSVSDDGCRVVFRSFSSDLVASDSNGGPDVFVRNRCTAPATTSLVSVSSAGIQGNAGSEAGRISGDGSKVAFLSHSSNLAAGTGSTFSALYLRDLNAGTTVAINTAAGAHISGDGPDLSRDASRVAYWSQTSPGSVFGVNGVWQIYVYDFNAVPATQPTLVSTDSAGNPQGQGQEGSSTITLPAISSDGGYVAFRSRGSGLVAGNLAGGVSHVYVKELSTGTIIRASVSSTGIPGNADSSGGGEGYRPGLARLAATVTFTTNATNLAPETGGYYPNVVAHNPRTGQTVGFSAVKTLNGLPNISDDGNLIVASSGFALDPAFPSSSARGLFAFAGMNELATRYRLYSPGTFEHLYTTDLNEYSVLPVCCAWVGEGAIYRIFRGAGGSLNSVAAVPYYRLYNPFSYQHHWTTDANEYAFLPTVGWVQEGIDGYVLPSQATGSVPLYRLYLNAAGGLHLWTIDANERAYLVANSGWIDEGIAGYVVPLP